MSLPRAWEGAASPYPTASGRSRPEIVSLPGGLPTVAELFSFARDAELRFETLKLRIEFWTPPEQEVQVVAQVIAALRQAFPSAEVMVVA